MINKSQAYNTQLKSYRRSIIVINVGAKALKPSKAMVPKMDTIRVLSLPTTSAALPSTSAPVMTPPIHTD